MPGLLTTGPMLPRHAWYWWLPDDGETEEDRREWFDFEDADVEYVAEKIVERKWHDDHPDSADVTLIALQDPHGEWHRVEVSMEMRPSFTGREVKEHKSDPQGEKRG